MTQKLFRLMTALIVICLCTQVAGCRSKQKSPNDDSPTPPSCNLNSAQQYCASGDDFACSWVKVLSEPLSVQTLQQLLEPIPGESFDELLLALFGLEDVIMVDTDLAASPFTFSFSSFDDYQVGVPIPWNADPYNNSTWQMRFAGLHFLPSLEPDHAAAVVVDFADRALTGVSTPPSLWYDHAISIRSARLRLFLDAYLVDRNVVSRQVLVATATLLLSELYAGLSTVCYRSNHNHGLMLDTAVVANAIRLKGLRNRRSIMDFAGSRFAANLAGATTADGIHRENSPAYHRFAVELAQNMVMLFDEADIPPTADLISVRNRLLETVIYMIQPNHTAPQFGDSDNSTRGQSTRLLLRQLRAQKQGPTALLNMFEYMWSGGISGLPPTPSQNVFDIGGYAAFRNGWRSESTVGHFTCSRHLPTHKQRDATSIEVYAHGTEVILNPGVYGYSDDPLVQYQGKASSHNILVVDGHENYSLDGPRPRITAKSEDEDRPWVVGCHQNFKEVGVPTVARLWAFLPPATFALVDQAMADGEHQFDQHLHLHPLMSEIENLSEHSVVARKPGNDLFPSLVIATAAAPERFQHRGVEDGDARAGWYFPATYSAEPATDLVFRFVHNGKTEMPMVIRVVAPGEAPPTLEDVSWVQSDSESRLSWTENGKIQQLSFPALQLAEDPACIGPAPGYGPEGQEGH